MLIQSRDKQLLNTIYLYFILLLKTNFSTSTSQVMAPTLKQTVQSVEPLLEQKDYDKVIEVLEGVKPSSSKSPVAPKLHLLLYVS